MIVNLLGSNLYLTSNLLKSSNGDFSVEGSVNCNGNIDLSGGDNEITKQGTEVSYSISCKGTVALNNGKSHNDIYYKTSLDVGELWDTNPYQTIQFDSLPGFQEEHDLVGYLEYLLSIANTGSTTFTSNIYNLKGYRTKSINVYELTQANLYNATEIKIGPNAATSHLLKVNSPLTNVSMTGITMNSTGVKPTPEDIIFAFDTPELAIVDCVIFGTIYAPNSNIILTNSSVKGAIIAKNITITGTGETSIENKLFTGYIEAPVAPEITVGPQSSINNYDPITVEIGNSDGIPSYYEIRYTLDGSVPTRESILYTGGFDLFDVGIVTVTAKLFGNGVEDGNTASQVYGFKCKTEMPSLVKDSLTGKYSISHQAGATVYYTVDGSIPSKYSTVYVQSDFEKIFASEGTYNIKFFASVSGCDDSEHVDDTIIVELPDTGVNPPIVNIVQNGSIIYSINPTYSEAKTFVFGKKPTGEAADPNVVKLLTTTEFTIADVYAMQFSMTPSSVNDEIMYTMDESNPINGLEYNLGDNLNIRVLSGNRLRAFSHVEWAEYSKQIDYTIIFRTTDNATFDLSSYELRSDEVLDSFQTGSSYAIDIAWVGPGVVTDDFAVYQALVNILATDMFERIFNPTFGVSITSKLAEIHRISSGEKIIADLKAEIEVQDPRIKIKEDLSYAYFDDSMGALVVDLVWVNMVTKNSAALKYAYDLDTIR